MKLLEREQYLDDLSDRLRSVPERGGCIALISGEAGIGKTSLLQAFAGRHPDSRFLWGACDALFTPRPLAPLHDIARQTTGPLAAAIAAGAAREGLFAAMLDEMDHPKTVMVLEDLHWADEATLDMFKYLGRRIDRTRAMIAVTFRNDEVGSQHPLRSVIGDLPRAFTHRVTPAPLSESAVESLARSSGRPAKDLYVLTGGNPLFVSEVLASDPGSVPVTVRDAVLARTMRLSAAARHVAEFVGVVPGRAESWLLRAARAWDDAAVEECMAVGMIRHQDGAVGYRHELVRRAVEDSLPLSRQQSLHGLALAALSARDGIPAARLAHHAAAAGSEPGVLHWAPIAAAQAAAVGAHREAAAHFQAAVASGGSLAPAVLANLNEGWSYECYLTDQIERAIHARTVALEIWRASSLTLKEGDALRWLSRLSWFAGRRADAMRYAADAIATLRTLSPGPELAMAYSNQAQLDMLGHESEPAILWARRAIELAEQCANREILSHALNNLGTARVQGGDLSGWSDLEHSLQIALDGGFQEHAARAYTNLSSTAVACRDYGRAALRLAEGLAYCQEHDLDSWQAYMLAWSARAHFERGEWLQAARAVDGVLRRVHTAPVSRVPALIVLGHLRIRRGDPGAASPLDEAAVLVGPIAEIQRAGPLAAARAEARWLVGDTEGVAAELTVVYDLAQRRPDPWMKGELAIWLWRIGRLEGIPAGVAEPYALEMAGDWTAAAREWRTLGCPYERALVLGWRGDESAQREALGIFEGLGTEPAAEALRRRMREQGVRKVPRGARASTQGHPFGLTRREAQTLTHMRDGLRNAAIAKRLCLSTRTVDHHVSSILAKLGVSTRAEAIEIARQQPEPTA